MGFHERSGRVPKTPMFRTWPLLPRAAPITCAHQSAQAETVMLHVENLFMAAAAAKKIFKNLSSLTSHD